MQIKVLYLYYKIENGNGECAKETTTQPQSRQQQKVTNRSSMQREIRRRPSAGP